MQLNLSTYATPETRAAALQDRNGAHTHAHRTELQSYLALVKAANPDVRTSVTGTVRNPLKYNADPYGVIDENNIRDAYLVMKFGDEALVIANTREGNAYYFTEWAARNDMKNASDCAAALMLAHVDAAATQPIDRYTLSCAPTNGFLIEINRN
ncbi:MAG: hypothetical protein LBF51_01830 [Zoogloeaceae bacterium]|jgi:hypothetical protein|nr:hypothetical protein [Zoogloeaceae bacterium]